MLIKIWYSNYWLKTKNEFKNTFFTLYLKQRYPYHEFVLNKNNPDIVFCSVFNGTLDTSFNNSIKVMVVYENLYRLRAEKFKRVYQQSLNNNFDYFITFDETVETPNNSYCIRLPCWYYDRDFYKKENSRCYEFVKKYSKPLCVETLKDKKHSCLISRSDIGNYRQYLLSEFHDTLKIDCPSQIGNNCESIESRGQTKHDFCCEYIFNFCPENSYWHGYVTEKLFDACFACNIPIYSGFIDHERSIFNMGRVIYIENFKDNESIQKAKEKVKYLIDREEELLKFYNQNIFNENALLEIQKYEKVFDTMMDHCINRVVSAKK